jgi:hypothetical protein
VSHRMLRAGHPHQHLPLRHTIQQTYKGTHSRIRRARVAPHAARRDLPLRHTIQQTYKRTHSLIENTFSYREHILL